MYKHIQALAIAGAIFVALFAGAETAYAVKGDVGNDLARYQGYTGVYAANDKFSLVQIGGTYGGTLISQDTYASQVAAAKHRGLRVHTYIWYGVGASLVNAKAGLDYYLPRVITPKGSIVALDYEDGASSDVAANTDAIIYGMQRIAQAGYTPMYYSYKPYTLTHVDYQRILKAFPNSLWLAAYPDYQVRSVPDYNWFPTMSGVAIWQFTSTHALGGLDGNVDLLGVTDNGYTKQPSQSVRPTTPVARPSNDSDYAQTAVFQPSTTLNVRTGTGTGYQITGTLSRGDMVIYNHVYIRGSIVWAQYQSYTGTRYVALGVMGGESYGSRSTSYAAPVTHTYYTVQSGDSWWAIASKYGISMYTLAANNGKSINTTIYPGQSLMIR